MRRLRTTLEANTRDYGADDTRQQMRKGTVIDEEENAVDD
jgi:hypothetical protein